MDDSITNNNIMNNPSRKSQTIMVDKYRLNHNDPFARHILLKCMYQTPKVSSLVIVF
jgi:PIN domain nuclease of toxin-antitoxin system